MGLGNGIAYIETLTKFTQETLSDSWQSLFLPNTELSLMRKVVLQIRMALDIMTASYGSIYAFIKTEHCVFIHDMVTNVSSSLNHMRRTQINALSEPATRLNDLTN